VGDTKKCMSSGKGEVLKGVVFWTEYFSALEGGEKNIPPAIENLKSAWGTGHSSGGGEFPHPPVIRSLVSSLGIRFKNVVIHESSPYHLL